MRPRWSEHLDCCDQLEMLAARFDPCIPTVVAGDFNQRLPRRGQPEIVYERLCHVVSRWTLHTTGDLEHGPSIDRIASNLRCTSVRTWPGRDECGLSSDRAGVVCTLRHAPAGSPAR